MDDFSIASKKLSSRLLMGSAAFPNHEIMLRALREGEAAMVTIAMRRAKMGEGDIASQLQDFELLPNTAGCLTAQEAILTAQLAREALGTNWVKLEVICDSESLLPDPQGLIEAARRLIDEGFCVLPYCSDDPALCRSLWRMGCVAVMPLAAPIGTGLGIRNVHALKMIRLMCDCPVIVDAGIGAPSHAAQAMELGCDAILVNSAIARAQDPIAMAHAMKMAVMAGRKAYLAGIMPQSEIARTTSPLKNKMNLS